MGGFHDLAQKLAHTGNRSDCFLHTDFTFTGLLPKYIRESGKEQICDSYIRNAVQYSHSIGSALLLDKPYNGDRGVHNDYHLFLSSPRSTDEIGLRKVLGSQSGYCISNCNEEIAFRPCRDRLSKEVSYLCLDRMIMCFGKSFNPADQRLIDIWSGNCRHCRS